MVKAALTLTRLTCAPTFAAILVASAVGVPSRSAHGQTTHLWTQSRMEEFEKGTPAGVALTSDGLLREAPGLKEISTTPSTFVWSVAEDKSGNAFVGTGTPATVLRISPDGKSTLLFETHDVSVQVVRIGPDGALYVATMPSGKVYRLNPSASGKQDESSAKMIFDAAHPDQIPEAQTDTADKNAPKADNKSHYIWDMTFDSAGRLYIATGGPAVVYRVTPAHPGAPEAFFKSDEQHIRSLAWDRKGNLIAGTDGSGLVYRINPEGKGYVLFEAPRREIPALTVGADGTIYAASVGDKQHNPLPPLPVQGTGVVTITVVQPGSLQAAANASTSAPDGTEIYALQEGQAPRKFWSGKDEVVYALASRKEGLLALTGNRGRIFLIHQDGTFADVGHLQAQQALSLGEPRADGSMLVGTGNTGKLVRYGVAETHEYASDVLDAGALARFGRIEVEPGTSGYQLFTRTGNIEQPVRGWSDWQPLNGETVASPAGRYLQWKAVLKPGGTLSGVGVNYLPVNAAPVVDEVVVVPGARLNPSSSSSGQPQTISISLPSANQGSVVSFDSSSGSISAVKDPGAVTARWTAHDDNGDELKFALYLKGDGEQVWRLLKDDVKDKAYTFDQTLIPDGGYQLKIVASDAPSHTPGDSLAGDKVSERFEIDTTAPVISNLAAEQQSAPCAKAPCGTPIHVVFDAQDAISPVTHAEYSLDAGPWQYIDPVGGLSDSRHEHYDFTIPAAATEKNPGEHLLTVRTYDRHDNPGLAKTVVRSAALAR